MWSQDIDSSAVAYALQRAGVPLRPEQITLERRDERWLALLPGRRLAWFAATPEGERSLAIERRALSLLRARCTFQVPELLFVDPNGEFDLRTMVGTPVDVAALVRMLRTSPAAQRRIGAQIGRILAEQHTRIGWPDVEPWLPRTMKWPLPLERVRSRLDVVVPDHPNLLAAAEEVLARYDAVPLTPGDHALAHTDIGFHNLAIGADGRSVVGLFDYESAAWADRHHDFRHLLFDADQVDLIRAAIDAYEHGTGYAISLERILLYNAVSAFSYLAARAGTGPEDRPCGRTLAEDVSWCAWATENVLGAGRRRLFG